jgi:hypothetical protein
VVVDRKRLTQGLSFSPMDEFRAGELRPSARSTRLDASSARVPFFLHLLNGLHIDNLVVWGETPLKTLISKLNRFKLSFLTCSHGASPHAGAGALDA